MAKSLKMYFKENKTASLRFALQKHLDEILSESRKTFINTTY